MILVPDPSFKRSLKRLTRKNSQLKEKVSEILDLLSTDPFAPSLKSHKLTGQLDGWWSCSVSYDCRKNPKVNESITTTERRLILLQDNIFNPMKAILHMPVLSNSLGKLSRIFG